MIFELMSDGTLAVLPQTSLPFGIRDFPDPKVVLLLPYSRYILGYAALHGSDRWICGKLGYEPEAVSLFDGKELVLTSDNAPRIALSGDTIRRIRSALLSQMLPPGEHFSAMAALRVIMKNHPVFNNDDFPLSEENFMLIAENDDVLKRCYWAVRLSLFNCDFEAVSRIKAWFKAGPELFTGHDQGFAAKIWFSLLALPKEKDIAELEALSFSMDDLQHMLSQNTVPLLLFNPRSGYLVLSALGGDSSLFRVWAFVSAALWSELRDNRKLSINELLMAVWGHQEVIAAMEQRERYADIYADPVSLQFKP